MDLVYGLILTALVAGTLWLVRALAGLGSHE